MTVHYQPVCCKDCGQDLADAEVVGAVTSQVIDLPPGTPVVTDHVAYRCRCACGVDDPGRSAACRQRASVLGS